MCLSVSIWALIQVPTETRGIRLSWNWSYIYLWGEWCGYRTSNSGALEEQEIILTTESFLQPWTNHVMWQGGIWNCMLYNHCIFYFIGSPSERITFSWAFCNTSESGESAVFDTETGPYPISILNLFKLEYVLFLFHVPHPCTFPNSWPLFMYPYLYTDTHTHTHP